MKPLVSIIIPNYNHASFLEQRMETVLNQTCQDFEIILLDDASTDHSAQVLEKFSTHPSVTHFIRNKTNSGSPFKQWRKGIELARGEFLWIAESDDFCELSFLDRLLNRFESDTVISYSASINVGDQNEILGLNNWADELDPERWKKDFRNNGKTEISHYLKYRNTIPNASAVLFRKIDLKDFNFPTHMKYCGDWYIWLKILETGNIVFNSKPLNYFRRHETSSRQTSSKKNEIKRFQEYLEIIQSYSSIWERVRNQKKYDWIIRERCRKQFIFRESMLPTRSWPIDFKLRYLQLCG